MDGAGFSWDRVAGDMLDVYRWLSRSAEARRQSASAEQIRNHLTGVSLAVFPALFA